MGLKHREPLCMQATTAMIVLCALVGACPAHAQETRSTAQGVFSEAQAKRGAALYSANCASCHGADLRSTDREVTNLSGGSFKSGWIGKSIGERFEVVRETMPPREERSLADDVYLDIITFIMWSNKVPAGAQELKPDLPALKQIKIADPPG
jgi:S-disulfanyl-L-cysteine oxidoreductase SoxD